MIEYLLLSAEQIEVLQKHEKNTLLLKDVNFSACGDKTFVSGYKFRINKIKRVLKGESVRFN